MPNKQPRISWEYIRNYTELYQYVDPKTGHERTSFNPPKDALQKKQMPYYVRYLTSDGELEQGQVITLKVFPGLRQRMIRFVRSGEIRRIRDYLILEVNGVRFVTT